MARAGRNLVSSAPGCINNLIPNRVYKLLLSLCFKEKTVVIDWKIFCNNQKGSLGYCCLQPGYGSS